LKKLTSPTAIATGVVEVHDLCTVFDLFSKPSRPDIREPSALARASLRVVPEPDSSRERVEIHASVWNDAAAASTPDRLFEEFKVIRSSFVAMLLFFSSVLSAAAGPIVGAAVVVTDMGVWVPGTTDLANVADQSGLSAAYTSGVDDFGTYLAGAPTHTSVGGTDWVSELGTTTGYVEFDLGALMVVDAMAIWNMAFGNPLQLSAAVTEFDLFANGNLLGSYTIGAPAVNPSLAQVIGFSPVAAQIIRMEITANNGSLDYSALGEVAFSAFPVPEPTAALLFGAGWLVVHTSLRRGRRH
jgi:hypothetical protein